MLRRAKGIRALALHAASLVEGGRMAVYHCPQCQQELTRGKPPGWVNWWIGPLFGLLLRTLVCKEHGTIETASLAPGERESEASRRTIGIVGAVVVNLAALVLIIVYWDRF
jgi:hypothetical protein